MADFDAGVLTSSQKGMIRFRVYLGTFLFIIGDYLVASVMPPEMAVVRLSIRSLQRRAFTR